MSRRHWESLGLQLTLLASMVGLALLDMGIYLTIISISLIVLPVANWTVALLLLWASHQDPTILSLADAADNSLTWAVNSSVAALIGAFIIARQLGFSPAALGPVITVLLGFVIVTASLPAIRFLRTWRDVWLPMIRRRQGR